MSINEAAALTDLRKTFIKYIGDNVRCFDKGDETRIPREGSCYFFVIVISFFLPPFFFLIKVSLPRGIPIFGVCYFGWQPVVFLFRVNKVGSGSCVSVLNETTHKGRPGTGAANELNLAWESIFSELKSFGFNIQCVVKHFGPENAKRLLWHTTTEVQSLINVIR